MEYLEFLKSKSIRHKESGISVSTDDLNPMLFDWQKAVTRWALFKGKSALFEDCGLGKTPQQLEWASCVHKETGKDVLILAPLAVSLQTQREGLKFGINVNVCKSQEDVKTGINITNYERLDSFDPKHFSGIVLDESSILKSFTGKYRNQIIDMFISTPYKLACTATPAPNDYTEIGNTAEFLGVMTRSEMLSMFFINDAGDTGKWRLKGHVSDNLFWEWLSSWAIVMRKPSDIGFDDNGFILPPIEIHEHVIPFTGKRDSLFVEPANTLSERRSARIESMDERISLAADLVNANGADWVVWCNLNIESESLSSSCNNSIEVKGSDFPEYKENAVQWFCNKKCICNESGFRAKLSTWKTKNNTSKNIIKETEIENWNNPSDGNPITGKEEKDTCKNTQSLIGKNLEEPQSSKNDTMKSARQNMPQMATCETGQENMLKTGRQKTLKKDSHKDLDHTELHLMNIEPCLQIKNAGVRFVGQKILATKEQTDSISITATQQVSSEDSYAPTAIWQSENSKTMQTQSKEPVCTCGGTSQGSKKILISKPKMFGYGLNLQNCHNMAFVGLSDSYEQYYQAVRRCWRFGQTMPVHAHIITGEKEGNVVDNIKRKEADMVAMFDGMISQMHELMSSELSSFKRTETIYVPKIKMELPNFMRGN